MSLVLFQDCAPRCSRCRDRKAVGSPAVEQGLGRSWSCPHPPFPWSLKLHLVSGSPFEAIISFLFSLCNGCKSINAPGLGVQLGREKKKANPPSWPVPPSSPSPVSPWQINWEPGVPFAAVHGAISSRLGVPSLQKGICSHPVPVCISVLHLSIH